jgi:hypothetical protein
MFTIINDKTIQVGGFIFRSESFDNVEDIGWAFSDGETQFKEVRTVEDFFARCLHIIQSQGGYLVTTSGEPIEATLPSQTLGNQLNDEELILCDGERMTVQELFRRCS